MIVADPKPLAEIAASVARFRHVLVVGCGACVTVCLAGGEREARQMACELSYGRHYTGEAPVFTPAVIERQCEADMVRSFLQIPAGTDAILSLACGVGVQVLAEVFAPLAVIPGLNTTFMGAADEPGVWREKCRGCGDCLLYYTGGICPLARCAKRLLNGPCGGTRGKSCEVHPDLPCAWVLIYERLKQQNNLDLIQCLRMDRDWRPAGFEGPRERRRTGVNGSIGDEDAG